MKTLPLVMLAAAFSLASIGILGARTWTEAGSGRTLDGDLLKVDGDSVVIQRGDGQSVTIPIARLSEEDQAFVKAQSAPAAGGTETGAGAAKVSGNELTLSGVHNCCGGCKKGIETALAGAEGVEFSIGGDTITLTGSSSSKLEKALEALAANGYYGESNHESLAIAPVKASDRKTDSVAVNGVHLCCGKCVKSVDAAMANVEGFKSHNAAKGSETFTVEGEGINAAAVLTALRAEGLSGTVE